MAEAARVLLIDDNPDDRALAARVLQRQFPEAFIEQIIDQEALERALTADQYDAIITEYQLEWTTGLDILRHVKAHDPSRPVIMFTNSADQESAVAAMKLGLDDYVVKSATQFARLPMALERAIAHAAERKARARLQVRLSTLLETVRVGVFRATPAGQLVEANPAFYRLIGIESTAATLSHVNLFARGILRPEMVAGQPYEVATAGLAQAGSAEWLLITCTTSELHGEQFLDGVAEDITAQKRTESRERFRAAVASALAASLDLTLRLEQVTPVLVPHLADWAGIYLRNREGTLLRAAHTPDDPELAAAIDQLAERYPSGGAGSRVIDEVITTGQPLHLANMGEREPRRGIREAGAQSALLLPLMGTSRPVGALALVMGPSGRHFDADLHTLAEDVAQRIGLAVVNASLYEHARDAITIRDTFLAVAAHELRTPLTALISSVQLAEMRTRRALSSEIAEPALSATAARQTMDQVHRLLNQSARQLARLVRLTDELTDASQISHGELSLNIAPANVVEVVRAAVEETRLYWPGRSIHFVAPDEPVMVSADAERVCQVVNSFLSNALRFSPTDEPVEVHVQPDTSNVRVSVHDHGDGIPPELQPVIWDRFYRVSGRKHQSGSGIGLGLGLYISREIVQRHGGSLGVESEPGSGSTFWFSLPLERADSSAKGPVDER